MSLKSINPYTKSVIEEFEEFSESKLEELLIKSANAFEKWKRTKSEFRRSLMDKVSGLLTENNTKYAESVTAEMGKPLSESKAVTAGNQISIVLFLICVGYTLIIVNLILKWMNKLIF